MADVFGTIVQNMMQMGFFQYLFPFLLALAVLYGILHWTMKDRMPKSAIGLISLILSFFVMLFVSANPAIVTYLMNISGYWLVIGCGILFIIVLLGLVGVKTEEDILKGEKGKWVLILVIIAIAVFIFFGAGGQALVGSPSWAASSELWTVIFFIVILAIVMAMIGGEKEKKTTTGGTQG